jgi:hypothetical protein
VLTEGIKFVVVVGISVIQCIQQDELYKNITIETSQAEKATQCRGAVKLPKYCDVFRYGGGLYDILL